MPYEMECARLRNLIKVHEYHKTHLKYLKCSTSGKWTQMGKTYALCIVSTENYSDLEKLYMVNLDVNRGKDRQ